MEAPDHLLQTLTHKEQILGSSGRGWKKPLPLQCHSRKSRNCQHTTAETTRIVQQNCFAFKMGGSAKVTEQAWGQKKLNRVSSQCSILEAPPPCCSSHLLCLQQLLIQACPGAPSTPGKQFRAAGRDTQLSWLCNYLKLNLFPGRSTSSLKKEQYMLKH